MRAGSKELFQPKDFTFRQDPYPVYATLREDCPVFLDADERTWFVTRYEDVFAVLSSAQFVTKSSAPREAPNARPIGASEVLWMAGAETHRAMRRQLANAIERRTSGLQNAMPAIAEQLIAAVPSHDVVDLLESVAIPFTSWVIGTLLGIPDEDRPALQRFAATAASISDIATDGRTRRRAPVAALRLASYFDRLIEVRASRPSADVVSDLLFELDDDPVTLSSLKMNLVMLLIAGQETTVNLIGNGILALMRHRDSPQGPILDLTTCSLAQVIEELLRYDSPSQAALRVATTECRLGDEVIRPGDSVWALIGSANRDEAAFHDPELLDLGRNPNLHLSFSHGPHYCLGAALARAEAAAVLSAICSQDLEIRLAGTPTYREHFVFRGLQDLFVRCRRPGAMR